MEKPMNLLEIELTELPAALVVHLRGDAGLAEAEALDRALMAVSVRHPKLVALELSGLNFISSLGMGALVAFQRGISMGGGLVRAAGPPQLVRDALLRARIDHLIPICKSLEEA